MADAIHAIPLLLAASDEKPPMLAVLLLGFGILLAIFLLMRMHWRRTASTRIDGTPRERIDQIRERAEGSASVQRAMAEATELAQRLGAQLDNKAERLEQLIVEAEAVIARMEGARPASRAEPVDEAEADVDPSTREIYALADEGLAPVEIAQRLDQHLGKVQLVLALRRA